MSATSLEFKNKGNEAFTLKNYNEAISHFSKAIDLDPSNHVLYSNRSGCYAALHQYDKALKDAEKCIKLKPDWPKGYSRRGLAEFNLNRIDDAIVTYKKGLEFDPTNVALQEGLKQAELTRETSQQALHSRVEAMVSSFLHSGKFKTYADEDPEFSSRLVSIVEEAMKNPKNLEFALATCSDPRLKEALMAILGLSSPESFSKPEPSKSSKPETKVQERELCPAEKEANEWKFKGNNLYKEKKFEEALQAYDKAIEINPNDITYLNNKAAVYLEMKEYDKCIEECQKALDKRYEVRADFELVAKVYNRMAVCYRRQGDYANAIAHYERSLLEDNNRHTRAALADVKRLKEKKDKEDYINPEIAEKHRAKGNEYFRNDQFPEAKKEYEEAIRRNPSDASLYANRAAALMKLVELPMALQDVDKSLELDPNVPKVWARKGNIHALMKEYNKAVNAYQSGLNIDPTNIQCKQGLDNVLLKIQQQSSSDTVDEDQVKHAMADPEIQRILADPQFCLLLNEISKDPSKLSNALKDPHIANGIQKLMTAGILRVA